MMSDYLRKRFSFEKDNCHPLKSEKYRKAYKHIHDIFEKEGVKGYGIISDLGILSARKNRLYESGNSESWKNSSKEFYVYPHSDWDKETYDKFYKLVSEYPWEEFGISKPREKESAISKPV